MDPADFVRQKTAITAPPLVPEIRLHLATEVTPIWQATEESLHATACRRPFGPLPGPVDSRWPATCSITPKPLLAARCSILAPARDWWRSPPQRRAPRASPPPISTLSRPRRLPSTQR